MEAGPAVLFTADELKIEPEPALGEGFDRIEFPKLDDVDRELDVHAGALQVLFDERQPEALGWQEVIDAASGALDTELADPPEQVPQDILDNGPVTQLAIDGAESSFTPDAYQDVAPFYIDTGGASGEEPDAGQGNFV